MTRVGFLGTGIVTAAAVAGLYARPATASTSVQVWGLDPSGGDHDTCGCNACRACHLHAANKLFASVADAGTNRAHAFCKCLVVPLALVDQSVYNALFLNGGARASVDRRSAWVQQALAQVAPLPDPTVRAAATDKPRVVTHRVQAALVRAKLRQAHGGERVLHIEIDAATVVTATITILRGREPLAHRRARVKGRQTLELAIPAHVKAGSARLRLNFHDAAGNSKLETRDIQLPPATKVVARRPLTHERI